MESSEELLKIISEGPELVDIPKWHCPVCDDDIESNFYNVYTHIATHMGELLKLIKEMK